MNKIKISSFEETARKKLGNDLFNKIDHEAQLIADNVTSMQHDISDTLKKYMNDNNIGFNEIQKGFSDQPAKTNSLIKGSGNFTIKTISELGAVIGKKARIVFE